MSDEIETATAELAAFEKTKDAAHLDKAILATGRIEISKVTEDSERQELRKDTADQWFQILAAIDGNLDPDFDENDPPPENVIPPRSGDVAYPSSVNPKSITDPAVRAEYEKMREVNSLQTVRFSLQLRLHRMEPRVTENVDRFVLQYFTDSADDQEELEGLLRGAKLSDARQEHFKDLFVREELPPEDEA
jgi:hypothetical protein